MSARSPSHSSRRVCWRRLTSWYSSTTKWRYWPRIGPGHLVVLAEDADHEEQDVLEVDDPSLGLDLLVGGDEPRHRRGVQAGRRFAASGLDRRGIRLGGEERDLRPLDLGREVAHGRSVEPQPQPGPGLRHGTGLVRHDLRGGSSDGLRPEVVELTQRRGVERPSLDAPHVQIPKPRPHLSGRAGREGHGQDPLRLVHPGEDPVGDAVGDGPGLARAGPGQDAHRSARVRRDLALLGVEGVEDGVRSGVHGQAGHRPDPRSAE